MKRLIVAKSAGFCFGVKRAVDTVYEQAKKEKEPIYTYGPIIHNEAVVEDLEKRGVIVIHSVEELRHGKKGNCHHTFPWCGKSSLRGDQKTRSYDRGCHLSFCIKNS